MVYESRFCHLVHPTVALSVWLKQTASIHILHILNSAEPNSVKSSTTICHAQQWECAVVYNFIQSPNFNR